MDRDQLLGARQISAQGDQRRLDLPVAPSLYDPDVCGRHVTQARAANRAGQVPALCDVHVHRLSRTAIADLACALSGVRR